MAPRILSALLFLLAAAACSRAPQAPALELRAGDRICLIGNTLAERMQHHGWLETLLQHRFPEHGLVVRNLGFSGDEIATRLRSQGFGSPDEHLARCRASVVFAFFGYNESFGGAAGLAKFDEDLAEFLARTAAQRYDGAAPPRIVLFSPIAHEDLRDPHLPDGKANNARLESYTAAMAAAAARAKVAFVDLFAPTRALFAASERPLTINGIHLTEAGDRALAEIVDRALFGAGPARDEARLASIREAVLDKDRHWFHRYRTTDGYSIYGGRGGLEFVDGQTNREVCERELEILDVMTANRDRRIQARARGGDLAIDDGNTPPFLEVKTNLPGKGPGGAHQFLSAPDTIAKMKVHAGMRVNVFASEEQFPELVNPQQAAVDTRGRLWVTAWPTYPHWKPKQPRNDKLLILPDEDRDGRADRCIVFADDLHNPTGFEFYNGGVLVAQVPDLWFLRDTDGDDRADVRERVLGGIDSADTHHSANSFVLGPGGDLFFQEGTFHHTQVETPWGPPVRVANGAVFRYEPRQHRFEVYTSYPFANPHGHVFDRWGQDFVTDGTGAVPYWGTSFSGHVDYPAKHRGAPTVYRQRTRPCAGAAILSSRHFPDELQGNWLVTNVIGFLGILQYRFEDDGAGFSAIEVEPIVSSSDPNFRPCDLEIGADGALYFTDWHNPIIGHMQHNLRDPSRDKQHGRVYRVTAEGRPLLEPERIAGEPVAHLVRLLDSPDDNVRYRARIELSARPANEVLAAVEAWTAELAQGDPQGERRLLEALWVHQQHDVVARPLLERLLATADFRARAAATRVLCAWRDRVPGALELLRGRIADEHPRVRLEAVRALSFFADAQAAEIALGAVAQPVDRWLDYTLRETLTTLAPHWRAAIAAGKPFAHGDPQALAFILDQVEAADLGKLPRTDAVCRALLARAGVADADRRSALAALADARGTAALTVLLETLADPAAARADLCRLLVDWPKAELRAAADRIGQLGAEAGSAEVRAAAFAAWIAGDGGAERAWDAAQARGPAALADLLRGIPLIVDRSALGALHERIRPLFFARFPESARVPGVAWRYFEGETLPDVALATLAGLEARATGRAPNFTDEVEGRSDAYALELAAALRVSAAGEYEFTTRSDDGSRLYVNGALVVDNDGEHGVRERRGKVELEAGSHRIVVTYQDNGGQDELRVFWKGPEFARREIEPEALSIDAETELRRAAIAAVASLPGAEAEKFADFARLIGDDEHRDVAARALLAMPAASWPSAGARALAGEIVARAGQVPLPARGGAPFLRLIELGSELAAVLPAGEGDAIRAGLADVSPLVVRIRAVPEAMRYDRTEFTVVAGKPVRLIFENPDHMPHNLLIVQPGSVEAVGALADELGEAGFERDYVPASDKILHHTRLIQRGESATLTFTAPTVPGDYGYVCTFPGHWRLMRGVMRVAAVPGGSK
jgi:azurin/glucose/arabinose dehydrogenase/lysophospholipase L1-like esterase